MAPIGFHGTRHTCATLMLIAGVPVKVVSELLGHSNVTITMSIYQRVTPGMTSAAGEALLGALGIAAQG